MPTSPVDRIRIRSTLFVMIGRSKVDVVPSVCSLGTELPPSAQKFPRLIQLNWPAVVPDRTWPLVEGRAVGHV